MTHSELVTQHQGLRELASRIIADARPVSGQSGRADVGVSPLLISALRQQLGEEKRGRRN